MKGSLSADYWYVGYNSQRFLRIKLFVVGLEERGKTSLCAAIIKKQRDRTPLATVGVVKTDWHYKGYYSNYILFLNIWVGGFRIVQLHKQ